MSDKKPTDIEEARKILKKESDLRVRECRMEVQGILDKHDCAIESSMTVTVRGNIPQVQIVPKPPQDTATDNNE